MRASPYMIRLLCTIGLMLGVGTAALAAPPPLPSVDPAIRSGEKAPKDVAVVVGNSAYAALPQFDRANDDARSMRDWLLLTRGLSKSRVAQLDNVRRDAILKAARTAARQVKKDGTVWFYYAGHGGIRPDGERVLLGVDADGSSFESRGVSFTELNDILLKSKAARVIFVVDAGFGNRSRDGLELVPGRAATAPEGWNVSDPKVVVLAAARDGGPAHLLEPLRHGLFTWSVLGALRGWADGELEGQRDGRVTLAETEAYVARVGPGLGYYARPTRDSRQEMEDLVLTQGRWLVEGPSAPVLAEWAREERSRRIEEAELALRGEATAFWKDSQSLIQKGGPEAEKALRAFIDEFSAARATVEWTVLIPEVAEARRVLATGSSGEASAPLVVAEGAPVEKCDDIVALEAPAMLGQLNPGHVVCLDARLKAERLQTRRNKISRLMIANAEASADMASWERLVARHLDQIDRSDPDLCMKYAVFLHKGAQVEDAEEAIRWADYALENKQVWGADDYVKRVNGLLRLRAEAAHRLWRDAEDRYRKDSTADIDMEARDFRGMAKDYSREWLDYARAAKLPTDTAFNLCSSAAGTMELCKEGAP